MAKGRQFLKIAGILMIIGGAISIIVGIVGLSCGAVAVSDPNVVAELNGTAGGGVLIVAGVIALIGGLLELITGIIGVKNCNKPEKAVTCLVFGIIVALINLVSVIMSIAGGSSAGSIIVSIITSLAIPAVYIAGAVLNKKSA